MDSQDLRNLQEAYMDVYSELDEQLDDNTRKKLIRYVKDSKKLVKSMRRETEYKNDPEPEGYEPESDKKIKKKTQREQVDIYDIILSHLLDEGYANDIESAEVIMVNMSEEWRENIVEGYKRFPYKRVEDRIHKKEEDNPTGRGTRQSVEMDKVFRHFKGGKEVRRTEKREHSPQISKAKEAENRRRGRERED